MEETIFISAFGNTPKIRVLDMLITGRELDYSISDIARQASISRATFYRMVDELIEQKIIKATRKIGTMQLYRLNQQNSVVKNMVILYDKLLDKATRKETQRQQMIMKSA